MVLACSDVVASLTTSSTFNIGIFSPNALALVTNPLLRWTPGLSPTDNWGLCCPVIIDVIINTYWEDVFLVHLLDVVESVVSINMFLNKDIF